jgi:hypothetical protein
METPQQLGAGTEPGAALRHEVERVQASGVLGEARSRSLFDYLAEQTLAGQAPKEIAIAMDVFGKTSDFDVSQDALVRVYIHKLRRALENFYSAATDGGAVLYIPRGEYRLKLNTPNLIVPTGKPLAKPRRFQLPSAAFSLLALLIGIAIGTGVRSGHWAPQTDLEQVRANPIWSGILSDDRPIMIVMGDYYLIGETDDSMEVKRLIREYSVNSKGDLERYLADHPERSERYMDVGLRYLPISAALALRNVMMVLASQDRRITVSKMSDLEPASLKSADIVYIGYLSGMGMFQDFVFTGSRFAIGESYDEVIDTGTHHIYVSEVGRQIMEPPPPTGQERSYHDYGIFAKLRGPGGNTIVVISGTRDEGVSQTAEAFTNAQNLQELKKQTDTTQPLEALLEVSAFNGTNLTGKVLLESNRDRSSAVP